MKLINVLRKGGDNMAGTNQIDKPTPKKTYVSPLKITDEIKQFTERR